MSSLVVKYPIDMDARPKVADRALQADLRKIDICRDDLLSLQGKNCGVTIQMGTVISKTQGEIRKLTCCAVASEGPNGKKRPDITTITEWGKMRKTAMGAPEDYKTVSLEIALTDEAKERFVAMAQEDDDPNSLWYQVEGMMNVSGTTATRIGVETYPREAALSRSLMLTVTIEAPPVYLKRRWGIQNGMTQRTPLTEQQSRDVLRFLIDEGMRKCNTLRLKNRQNEEQAAAGTNV